MKREDELQKQLQQIGIPESFVPTIFMTDLNTREGKFDTA